MFQSISEQLTNLRQDLAAATDEAQAIQNLANEEARDMTDEEAVRWGELLNEGGIIEQLNEQIEKLEQREKQAAALAANRRQVQTALTPRMQDNLGTPLDVPSADYRDIVAYAPRLKAFSGEDAARNAYLSGMWMRMMIARCWGEPDQKAELICDKNNLRAQHVIGDPAKGGYTVPKPLARELINILDTVGVSRQTARVMPMTANTLDVPKKGAWTDVPVKYPGEATAIATEEQTFSQVNLVCVKRAILTQVSQELSDDSIIPFIDDLARQMAYELAQNEDREYILGDGTATYGGEDGLLPTVHANGVVTLAAGATGWADVTLEDITGLMGTLPNRFQQYPTSFICSSEFYYSVMLKVLAQGGGNAIFDLQAGDRGVLQFLGKPVYITSHMATTSAADSSVLIYGAFDQAAIIGSRQEITMGFSRDRYFDLDVTAVRATLRADINVHEPGTAAGAGAYVVLKTAAT